MCQGSGKHYKYSVSQEALSHSSPIFNDIMRTLSVVVHFWEAVKTEHLFHTSWMFWKMVFILWSCEIESNKSHSKWIWEDRRGCTYAPSTPCQLPPPTGRSGTLLIFPTEETYFTTPVVGRKIFSWPRNSPANEKLPPLSQWEATSHPELSLFSNGLSLKSAPLRFLLFLHKATFLSFVLQTGLWFCYSLHALNCNSVIPK